jgi:hypothetical protein
LPNFRSFRGRLVAVFVGRFAVILATCFLVGAAAVRASARDEVNEELRLAGTLFVRQLESRSQQLVAATRLLSGDFALKTAAATSDQETTRSVLANHRQRIGADVLLLASRRRCRSSCRSSRSDARRGLPDSYKGTQGSSRDEVTALQAVVSP